MEFHEWLIFAHLDNFITIKEGSQETVYSSFSLLAAHPCKTAQLLFPAKPPSTACYCSSLTLPLLFPKELLGTLYLSKSREAFEPQCQALKVCRGKQSHSPGGLELLLCLATHHRIEFRCRLGPGALFLALFLMLLSWIRLLLHPNHGTHLWGCGLVVQVLVWLLRVAPGRAKGLFPVSWGENTTIPLLSL